MINSQMQKTHFTMKIFLTLNPNPNPDPMFESQVIL